MTKNKIKLNGEISYDFIMSDDMSWLEGCYRLPYKSWEVICVLKEANISRPKYKIRNWGAGITGIVILLPQNSRLNAKITEGLLSRIFKIQYWLTVQGPDSLRLRCTADLSASKTGVIPAMAVIDDNSKDEIFQDIPPEHTQDNLRPKQHKWLSSRNRRNDRG